ncbi:hypothetical protein [Pedobacter sp. R-06]|uniref:hypothetical protein n=1 Tax=Pedobacter sp. R-06 TaxID=3404051 RepID=UPI003CFA300F
MKNKDIVFSIVAKNYLPLAFTLGESLKKHNTDLDFCILLVDKVDDLKLADQPFKVYSLNEIDLSRDKLENMSFKYNLTEFCTAVKPFFFDFVFKLGYEKAIYFDPDICTFSSVQPIFDELNNKSIVVTPHFCTPELDYTGLITESLLLHVGAFNFGFVAVSSTMQGKLFINWWMARLYDKCYQDKLESLHTDQKWGDLIPSYFPNETLISHDIGRNMAFWNLHERNLIKVDGNFYVQNKLVANDDTKLIFFHFAGFDISGATGRVHKNHPEYMIEEFPALGSLFSWYADQLKINGYDFYIKFRYGFDFFDNGELIQPYHRRLYRRLFEDDIDLNNPFAIKGGKFYGMLKNNKLLSGVKSNALKGNHLTHPGFESKMKKLNKLMLLLKFVLGVDKYFLLLKFMQRYSRTENQSFLVKEVRDDYYFINENINYRKLNQKLK